MVIVVGGQKGGTGKSSLATNLAVAAAHAGRQTLLVDGDPQRTATTWARRRRAHPHLPRIECLSRARALHSELLVARHSCDEVLVDLAGGDLDNLRTALLAADLLLLPLRPSSPDLWTARTLDQLAREATECAPGLAVLVVLSLAPTNPRVAELREARLLLARHRALHGADAVIHERKAYRDALASGLGVLELEHAQARDELLALSDEIAAFRSPRAHARLGR
jgi:chromosome partitioning protein